MRWLLLVRDVVRESDGTARGAALVSVVTAVPDFPGDGTVVLSDWASDVVPLTAHMAPDEVAALRD